MERVQQFVCLPAVFTETTRATVASEGGYVSFSGTWEVEHVTDVFKVRLELRNLTVEEGSREGMYDSITLTVLRGRPRHLAFSIFNGDFDDLVYEPEGTN